MTDSLSSVCAAIDELAGFEPLYVPMPQKRELLRGLVAAEARLAAVRLAVLATAGDVADDAGAKDPASWLSHDQNLDKREARADQALAKLLAERWHAVAAALGAGEVTLEQARAIANALDEVRDELSAAQLVEAERTLLTEAKRLDPAGLRKLGRHLADVVDPDSAEEREAKRLADEEKHAAEKAKFSLRPQGDGTTRISGRLPDAVAKRLKRYLEAFAQPRKQAAESDGRRVPYATLMARAMGDLLERVDPGRLPDHGGDATTVVVTITLDQLRTELASGGLGYDADTPITAATARRLACNATIIPMVLGAAGQVLDVGRASRLHTPVQRKVIRLRDKKCRAAGCDASAEWCEVHHLVEWSQGGKTTVKNGILLCCHHHHRIHDPAYHHERQPDGDIRFSKKK
ncbi:HNH endonuclease signature motif containing protein [Nocardioides jensenii]|uniref:HNH endonuclease signature motif containing protein n=1 Tax=Nocardioides jensenii TaxID=1843 RepID=UPI00146FDA90|nr:HNH endonuclease signature motif containing protein [Nocardioides jensenii]